VRVEDRMRIDLGGAEVEVVGPAAVEVSRRNVVLRAGQVQVFGDVDVAGPACTAHVRGRGDVELRDTRLVVRVFAGSAEITPPELTCEVIDLSASSRTAAREPAPPASPAPAPAAPPIVEEAPPPPEREPARPPSPATRTAPTPNLTASALKQQSDAYWAAQRLREQDPAAALALLHDFTKRWPRSPLGHEVDLAAVDTLVQLGRADDARAAARRFLRRFPDSARADHVRTIAGDRDD